MAETKDKISADSRLVIGADEKGESIILSPRLWDSCPGAHCYRWPEYDTLRWVTSLPERKELKTREFPAYRVPLTAYVVSAIVRDWPAEQVAFSEAAAQLAFQAAAVRARHDQYLLSVVAKFKATGELPPHDDLEIHPDRPLAPHQILGAWLSMRKEGYGYFFEQGTGKTATAICRAMTGAARVFESQKRAFRALVVCPKNILSNWAHEFELFATRIGNVTILRGTEVQRIGLLAEAFRFTGDEYFTAVLCSYDVLKRMSQFLIPIPWDLAILDESHYVKDVRTDRAHAVKLLRGNVKSRLCLTGTPVANTPLDLYSQLEFLGHGYSGFGSWDAFRAFFGVFEDTAAAGFKKFVKAQNLPVLKEMLAACSFSVTKREVLKDLPEKTSGIIDIEMTPQQQDAYDRLADQLALEIESEIEGGANKELLVANILVKLLRLAEITSGYISWDGPPDSEDKNRRVEYFGENPKLVAMLEDFSSLEKDEKAIIWARFRANIKQISEALDDAKIEHVCFYGGMSDKQKDAAAHRFNHDPSCRVFLGNHKSGGGGLNLLGYPPERAADYETDCTRVYYFSSSWSATERQQAGDRAHRRGTRRPVHTVDLLVPGTIDSEIHDRVAGKIEMAREVSDLREILNALRRK